MIAIIDYGVGNVQAFANIYKQVNIPHKIIHNQEELVKADKIILPGVGSFDWAMSKLIASGMSSVLNDLVLKQRRPILGVCVGMQMMANSSEEGVLPGLGWLNAKVKRLDMSSTNLQAQLPHMGWNDVHFKSSSLFTGIRSPLFYFLHSYYFAEDNISGRIGSTDYYGVFTSAVAQQNIFGVQFHPEKSHASGVCLLKNFAEL